MNKLIIQTSPMCTASTLLVNALYGLIPELSDSHINFSNFNENELNKNIIVIKSHNLNIDEFIEKYKDNFEIYFICSERKEYNLLIDEKYKLYDNVIVFSFEELNETEDNTIPNIINNIYTKIKDVVNIDLNIESGIDRINRMNTCYNEIKDKQFDYIDYYYHIHGSHRNRPK